MAYHSRLGGVACPCAARSAAPAGLGASCGAGKPALARPQHWRFSRFQPPGTPQTEVREVFDEVVLATQAFPRVV